MAGQVAHPESLVETDWVAEHLSDGSIRLVEVDVDLSSYAEAHIPGAIQWDWMSHLNATVQRDILSRDEMSQLLGNENVRNYDGSWTEYGSMIGVPIEL